MAENSTEHHLEGLTNTRPRWNYQSAPISSPGRKLEIHSGNQRCIAYTSKWTINPIHTVRILIFVRLANLGYSSCNYQQGLCFKSRIDPLLLFSKDWDVWEKTLLVVSRTVVSRMVRCENTIGTISKNTLVPSRGQCRSESQRAFRRSARSATNANETGGKKLKFTWYFLLFFSFLGPD